MAGQQLHPHDYTIGWISALPIELAAAQALLDKTHAVPHQGFLDTNIYTLGQIAGHNVVIAALPHTRIGPSPAAWVAAEMKAAFPNLQFMLMVGVGGGVPQEDVDIRLGDVVVGRPNEAHGGVVQYDSGKMTTTGFQRTGFLNSPPTILLKAITQLMASSIKEQEKFAENLLQVTKLKEFRKESTGPDVLFQADYDHAGGGTCAGCDKARCVTSKTRDNGPVIHYGAIASGNRVIKNARERDELSAALGGVICFEMEAAGLVNDFPCLVVRGICDYADSHKNKSWQSYASATAAAYTKTLLSMIPPFQDSNNNPNSKKHYFAKKRRLKSLAWFSSSSYSRTHQQIQHSVVPGTAVWLFTRHKFRKWKNEPDASAFWLRGLPGYGKTCIASTVVDQIARETKENTTHMMNYFYCSNGDPPNNASIVLTFLHQLLARKPIGYNIIEERYDKWASQGLYPESVQLDELWALFHEATGPFKRVYVVIDGIDLLEAQERWGLLGTIGNLLKDHKRQYKVFISSRNFPEIRRLDRCWQLDIQPSDNESDIRKLVHTRVESNELFAISGVDISPDTKQYISHILIQRSKGMFLWVHLQLEELCHAATENEMIALVDNLPTDLERLYHRLKRHIDQDRKSRRFLAYAILEFLTFTEQPMTLDSIIRGISWRTEKAGLYADNITLELILSACHGLAVYDEHLDTLCLVHPTARDYLVKTFVEQQCHAWIAEACLRDLLQFASRCSSGADWSTILGPKGPESRSETSVDFTMYAAMRWHYHSRKCVRTPEYESIEWKFLCHETAPRVWVWIIEASNGFHAGRLRTLSGFLRTLVDPYAADCMYLAAAFFGLDNIFANILMKGDIAICDDIVIPAFSHARRCISWVDQSRDIRKLESRMNQYIGLSERVVEKDAEILASSDYGPIRAIKSRDIDIRDDDLRDILHLARLMGDIRCAGAICAAEQGHKDIFIKIYDDLLRRNPMSKPQFRYFVDTCQRLASIGGHFGILEVMRRPEVDFPLNGVSPCASLGGSLLGLSAFVGNKDMLLHWRQNLGILDATIDLTLAAIRNDERATRLLMENFHIDMQMLVDVVLFSGRRLDIDPNKCTPLMAAVIQDHHRIVRILLRHPNIDINHRTGYGNTNLMRASGGLVVTALCKHKDLDIHLRNNLGETALEIFMKLGHISAIEALAKHPTFNANQRNRWKETPLIAAVRMRDVDVVEALLRIPSTDIDARDEDGLNAMDIATRLDHGTLIKLLSSPPTGASRSVDLSEDLSVALIRTR